MTRIENENLIEMHEKINKNDKVYDVEFDDLSFLLQKANNFVCEFKEKEKCKINNYFVNFICDYDNYYDDDTKLFIIVEITIQHSFCQLSNCESTYYMYFDKNDKINFIAKNNFIETYLNKIETYHDIDIFDIV